MNKPIITEHGDICHYKYDWKKVVVFVALGTINAVAAMYFMKHEYGNGLRDGLDIYEKDVLSHHQ